MVSKNISAFYFGQDFGFEGLPHVMSRRDFKAKINQRPLNTKPVKVSALFLRTAIVFSFSLFHFGCPGHLKTNRQMQRIFAP